jgi:EAL domain-containing protein (putative c-di-GMP-specific phosphodiesterase class I)
VKEILSRPFLLDREVAELRANVGWASAENQINTLELFRRAEMSLAMNTETAGLNDKPYSPKMDQKRKEERSLEFDFRKAIMLDQFELHYQMQLDYSSRKITGFEALIRWNHPERGMIYPDLFIPLAEKSGLIVAMGEWVIKTACKEAVKWAEDIRIAVNVSPIQLQNKNLVKVIEQALSETGLSAKRLEIEITESAEIQNEAESRQCLLKLKELGLSIALDDFGTGYASLSYLRSFPFDKLKIDQSFVRCEENQVENDLVLQSMFALGKCFGMKTLAEGIETEEHQAKLLNLGCENAQGYLYSRPVPFSETFELLKRFNNIVYTPHASFKNNPGTSVQDISPESGLFQIAYISDNTTATSPEQLTLIMKSIQEASKKNNEADNISGALMFNQLCFAQILEGESHVIEKTFERIQCDPRHQNIQVLDYRSIETRSFPDWAMAFIGESVSNTNQFDQLSIIRGTSATDDRTARLQQVLLQSVYSNDASRKAA